MKGSELSTPFVSAVIVAAGSAVRMNCDKMLMPVCGIPCICRTLAAFEAAETVGEIVVVTRAELIPAMDSFASEYLISKYSKSVTGGNCRQASAVAGFSAVSPAAEFVCVHDGARPLVSSSEIDEVNRAAFQYGAAACGTMVKDTVKVIGKDGYIEKTLDRSVLSSIATPQTFSRSIYTEAVEKFGEKFAEFTDDSGMVEAMGVRVRFVKCSYSNIKITTPDDIAVASKLLGK